MTKFPTEPTRSALLEQIATLLDIPEALMTKAQARYKEVADWLGADGSELLQYTPLLVPQGSAKLGTMVRPILRADEYDLDSVVRLWIPKGNISQKDLKALVGERLAQKPEFKKILSEGRRCWRLDFEEKFHLDVLPAIPNLDGAPNSLLITDKELYRWQHSHPIGYASWFVVQTSKLSNLAEPDERVAKALNMRVEEVPDWKVKTPLQRVVQILKRHRDIYFGADDDKPISIILTTLAAQAYDGSSDIERALLGVLENMDQGVKERNGEYWVENPVDEAENFADKWKEHPKRKVKFDQWLQQARQDFGGIQTKVGIHNVAALLGKILGQEVVTKALTALGQGLHVHRVEGGLAMEEQSGKIIVGSPAAPTNSFPIKRHDFYGEPKA